jgi:hypothetical protein
LPVGIEFPAGSPESFEYLAAHFDDIRGERLTDGVLLNLFPRTTIKILRFFGKAKDKQVLKAGKRRPDCHARIEEAADAFIANRRVIADLSSVRGAGYLLVLQPHAEFLFKNGHDEEAALRQIFYRDVMGSALCHKFRCIDMSRSFAGIVPLRVEETPDSPNRAIFADKVHLTDNGYASVAALVASAIRGPNPPERFGH